MRHDEESLQHVMLMMAEDIERIMHSLEGMVMPLADLRGKSVVDEEQFERQLQRLWGVADTLKSFAEE